MNMGLRQQKALNVRSAGRRIGAMGFLWSSVLVQPVLSAAPGQAATERPPNFVVILIDDMGYGDIGPFGSKVNRTPNLDRMAAEGMKLTSFYCAPVCSASRAQLMTGCYFKRVSIHGALMPVSRAGISPDEKTIADYLKPLGYATMCVGKWHLGDQPEFLPTRHGFDHYFGLPYSNDMGSEFNNKQQKNDTRPPLPLMKDSQVIEQPANQDMLTARYTEEAVKFITANREHPFFLYLPHTAVHVPMHPGDAFKGKSANGLFGDWVEEVDWSVGRVLQTLRDLKLDRNTLVVFTSDNGPALTGAGAAGVATPLRGNKLSTWEGGCREPTLAWWPGRITAGSASGAVLSEMDMLPTLVRLAGGTVDKERPIDGVDIWPVLSGQAKESPRDALYYFVGGDLEAVRSGPWKMAIATQREGRKADGRDVFASREAPRLYNLDADIGETTNVASNHLDVVERLQALISKMDSDLGLKGKGPGVRPCGRVEHPQPLLKRAGAEYD